MDAGAGLDDPDRPDGRGAHEPADVLDRLDEVLQALANRHRREIVYVLGLQPCSIAQLAGMRGLSLPAIHKHLKILQDAGMIRRHKRGRTTYLSVNRTSLQQLQDWVGQFHPYWGSDEATLENYDSYLGITRDPKDRS